MHPWAASGRDGRQALFRTRPALRPCCTDLQAMDRAFRRGQKRDVAVYRLVASGTMEELIYTRQICEILC